MRSPINHIAFAGELDPGPENVFFKSDAKPGLFVSLANRAVFESLTGRNAARRRAISTRRVNRLFDDDYPFAFDDK